MACAPGDRKIQAMEEPKRLFRVALYKEGTSPMEICAAMRHEGEIWLVPDWIRSPRGRSAKPLRMIPLSKFPHKKFPRTSEAFADYAVDGVVPNGLSTAAYHLCYPPPLAFWSGPPSGFKWVCFTTPPDRPPPLSIHYLFAREIRQTVADAITPQLNGRWENVERIDG